MRKSKLLVLGIMCCMAMPYGCTEQDEPTTDGLTPELTAVKNLLEKGGRITTLPEKNEQTTISEEKSDTPEWHTDESTGSSYLGYAVKRTDHYNIVDNPMEFVTLDPWDVLWPGALVQGKSLKDGVPASVPIYKKRKPGKIYLSLVSGNENMDTWFKEVPMSGANVTQAMNELLSKHLNANPARTAYQVEVVSSSEQLALKLGINLSLWGSKINQNFGSNWNKSKSYVTAKLNQIFFTMSYEGPDGGFRGAFTDDITTEDLRNFTGPDNPICYVNSVSYGRSYIMLYESSASANSLEAAVRAAFLQQEVAVTATLIKTFNEAKCKLVQIGGDPVAGLETVFGDFEKINAFLTNGAVVSPTNIGAPISYKLSHLVDNSTVRLSNTLEYDFTSQMFQLAEPKNNIVIDILDACMLAPSSDRTVSNHSTMTLKKVNVSNIKVNGDFIKGKAYLTSPITLPTKGQGAQIPIYKALELSEVGKDTRIRIEAEFYVKNETYGGATKKEEGTFTLIQDFEFNPQNNAWSPIKEANNAFTKLSIHKDNFGKASMDFQLNYRFMCDGIIYPIKK